jgi:hypothetical protein
VGDVTRSADFPVTTTLTPAPNCGDYDGFAAKLSPGGSAIAYATYLGGFDADCTGSAYDEVDGIAVDPSTGALTLTGFTSSTNFPVLHASQSTLGGPTGDSFATRLMPDGSGLDYSTYLGGVSGGETGFGVALDASGDAFVVGATASADFPVVNAIQSTYNSTNTNGSPSYGSNGFVTELSPADPPPPPPPTFSIGILDGAALTAVPATWGRAYFPGPTFPITVSVRNTASTPAHAVVATLNLGAPLQLASTDVAAHSLGDLAGGASINTTWNVVTPPPQSPGSTSGWTIAVTSPSTSETYDQTGGTAIPDLRQVVFVHGIGGNASDIQNGITAAWTKLTDPLEAQYSAAGITIWPQWQDRGYASIRGRPIRRRCRRATRQSCRRPIRTPVRWPDTPVHSRPTPATVRRRSLTARRNWTMICAITSSPSRSSPTPWEVRSRAAG